MRRKRKAPEQFDRTIDANQIVGANFRLARELRGWTQEEAARELAPYLGQVLPKASISAIERVLDRDRRRVFNAQELVAFCLGFDLPIWWFLLPVPGSDTMRLDGTEEPASNLLSIILGRNDQLELLRDRVGQLRRTTDGEVVDEILGSLIGATSWQHLEETRLLAIQELGYREVGTIERLIGDMRDLVGKFDGVLARTISGNVEMAAFMDWKPTQVYRKTSEVILGRAMFGLVNDQETSRPWLGLLLSREDLPLEDWIDTDDPELRARVVAVFDQIEHQLSDKEMPPPPDQVAAPDSRSAGR